jgi:hypothetical protein
VAKSSGLEWLIEIVLATVPVREATDKQLVRLPTGDGMALVFRRSAEEPARCPLEIAEGRKHLARRICDRWSGVPSLCVAGDTFPPHLD